MNVVVADDSRISRDMLRRILRDGGHNVVGQAANGQEAIDLCKELKPDALTLDLSMPKVQGQDVAREVVSVVGRVVIVSSMNQGSTRRMLEELGCRFVAKPYDSAQILRALADE